MKPNPHKLSDFDKNNNDMPPGDNQMMNLSYLMKKRKEDLGSKGLEKQPKLSVREDEEKNKKTSKSIYLFVIQFFFKFEVSNQTKI